MTLQPQPYTPGSATTVIQRCELSLPSPEENLACDEVLLNQCDASPERGGFLRFWEPDRPFVVVGYANRVATEVNLAFCHQHGIPVLRRCSGGGTVMQNSGCINYSLVLPIHLFPQLQGIHTTNDFILEKNARSLSTVLGAPVEKMGDTDLAIGGLKFSGNAQRRKRQALIFHGCILLDLDFSLVEHALPMPSKQPAYRLSRPHSDFLLNLKVRPGLIKSALAEEWNATERFGQPLSEEIAQLTAEKYRRHDWNFKF